MSAVPATAMVLSAGLGRRLRPITETLPKPLVKIGGKAMLDRALDALAEAGTATAVVNVHHLGARIIDHVAARRRPKTLISDERAMLLDSAGGIVKALPLLGARPFFVLNSDTFWIDQDQSNLVRLAAAWDDDRMDILLMIADPALAIGHSGGADFLVDAAGRLQRARGAPDGAIYAGAAILHPRIFAGAPVEPHSLNRYFDQAIASGRLYGQPLAGRWFTVGTPDAIPLAEAALDAAIAEAEAR